MVMSGCDLDWHLLNVTVLTGTREWVLISLCDKQLTMFCLIGDSLLGDLYCFFDMSHVFGMM
jgi:hypothetical protein